MKGDVKRSYGQYCAVARGLDLIGDRWTLLIARDLLLGPRRYKDLLDGLPGVGTNLLAVRLREMEQAGLVERAVLPPPAGAPVYRLTGTGAALEPVITAIGRWGGRFLGRPGPGQALAPRPFFVAIRSSFRAGRAAGLAVSYELRVDGLAFEVRVRDGRCSTREGAAADPDVVMEMDVTTLNALLMQGLPAPEAIADGRILVTGDTGLATRFVDIFAIRNVLGNGRADASGRAY
jgi:DNA-binding HxlR family transcriptional regulator/putative sterol carrier protein